MVDPKLRCRFKVAEKEAMKGRCRGRRLHDDDDHDADTPKSERCYSRRNQVSLFQTSNVVVQRHANGHLVHHCLHRLVIPHRPLGSWMSYSHTSVYKVGIMALLRMRRST